MKRVLALILVSLVLTGCVAIPVYDDAYYPYSYYGPYPYYYGYVQPEVSVFFGSGFYGHSHGYYGGHGFHGGRR